jgi:glycosyltransferase involved in cell wall biosynthesis
MINWFSELPLLGYLFAAVILAQVVYFVIFMRFAFKKKSTPKQQPLPAISIIVCGRNEAANFAELIPQLMQQDYHDFEVIAVNDQSIDDSNEVLEKLGKQYPKLRIVEVQENDRFFNGKKFGLTLGIKAAKNDFLLFTDADCRPVSNQWVKTMAAGFLNGKSLVLGFGTYTRSWNPLNMLIRFETVQTGIQYFAWALAGMPYMGVGRNLAYHRKLFYEAKGFVRHMHLAFGDDDLFVNDAATATNTAIVFEKDSHTVSQPHTDFKGWFFQKRRHLAAGPHYKKKHNLLLGLFGLTTMLFYFSLALGFILYPQHWIFFAVGGGLRLIIQYAVYIGALRKLGNLDLLLLLPLLELGWVLMTFAQHTANKIYGPPKRWKFRPFKKEQTLLETT